MKIVIDAFGGDNAPKEIVLGGIRFLRQNKNLNITLVFCGDQDKIKSILENCGEATNNHIEIVHAPSVISNDESPTLAIRQKTDSSLVACFNYVKEHEDCMGMLSAGSTGAVLTGAVLKIGRISGVSRPALAPMIPTKDGKGVLLVDAGANMDTKAVNLCHFAVMANEYMKSCLIRPNNKIAILNVGTEDHKGNELTKEAFAMLKDLDINFVGNCEARDILSGEYDVVVSDGFAGNVLLKGIEGTFFTVMDLFKKDIKSSLISKIGAIFMKNTFKRIKKKLDYNNLGGAIFLGVKTNLVKAHGSSSRFAISKAIEQVYNMSKMDIVKKIENNIKLNIEAK